MASADAPSAPLSLSWTFGLSPSLPAGGLASLPGHRVAYAAAHTALVYDRAAHTQAALQGHGGAITCLAASSDKKLLATADAAGSGALAILWDAATGEPVRTIPLGESGGALCVDFAPDGASLAVLTAATSPDTGGEQHQEVLMYDLKANVPGAAPVCATAVPPGDVQTCIRFPTNRNTELVSNGRQRTFFWVPAPATGSLAFHSPPVRSRDFKQALGTFTQSAFVPRSTAAVTGTSDGDVVLWEEGVLSDPGARASDRRATKVLRIHSAAVRTLVAQGPYLVSGGEDGFVRFFDSKLKLSAWFEELDAGPVTAIAFDSRGGGVAADDEIDDGAGGGGVDGFSAPDMIVVTGHGRVVHLRADSFDLPSGAPGKRGVTWLEGTVGGASALAVHPFRNEIMLASSEGKLQVWDYARRRLLSTVAKEKCAGSCLTFSPDGNMVAVGCSTGHLRLLTSPPALNDVETFRFTTASIKHVAFSPDGKMVAVADARHTVALVTHGHGKSGERWELVGKYHAHASAVLGVHFSPGGDTFSSLDADGVLATFDARGSTAQSGLLLVRHEGMTHGDASPTAFAVLPRPPPAGAGGAESVIVAADVNLKLKTYEQGNYTCVSTELGPAYGGPVTHLVPLSRESANANDALKALGKDVLCYACSERAAGLCLYPHRGDPRAAVALVVHPGGINACVPTPLANKVVTLGDDGIVNLWNVSIDALAASLAAEAAADPSPLPVAATDRTLGALLEGGLEGEMLAEARDYFYYAQLRAQGEETTQPRRITGTVVASDVPDLLCAMGYYPSEAEVQDILTECQLSSSPEAADDQEEISDVSFSRLMLLLANHRPLKGIERADIEAAFRTLGADPDTGVLSREHLIEALGSYGEFMSQDELDGCLGALYGAGVDSSALPDELDSRDFAEGVLGFEELVGQ